MKTKIKEIVTTESIYSFDKFPTIVLHERKTQDGTTRRICAARGVVQHVYLKELTLMLAKYVSPCDLPYSLDRGSESFYQDSDASLWCDSLAVSHNGQSGFLSVPKERFAEFEQDVLSIDFRIYDVEKAKELKAKYQPISKVKKSVEVDAIAIAEAENE